MRSFPENSPSDKTIQRINTRFLCTWAASWQLTQPFTPTKNDIRIEGYFIVDMILRSRNQHLTFWREQKTYEKNRRGKLRWLTFTNRFDNHKSIWALSDKYQSDAKWFGKHNGIINFCLNLIAAKAFIAATDVRYSNHGLSRLFFYPAKMSSVDFYFNSLI